MQFFFIQPQKKSKKKQKQKQKTKKTVAGLVVAFTESFQHPSS